MKVVYDCHQHPPPVKMELPRDGGSGGRGGGQPTKGGNTGGEVRKWKWKFLRRWKSQSESFLCCEKVKVVFFVSWKSDSFCFFSLIFFVWSSSFRWRCRLGWKCCWTCPTWTGVYMFFIPHDISGANANTCFTAKHATPRTLVWLGIDIISSQYEEKLTLSMRVALILGVTDT